MAVRSDDEQVEVGFEWIRSHRFVDRCRRFLDEARATGRLEAPDHWRELNPDLTISDEPFADRLAPHAVSAADASRFTGRVRDEGYSLIGPIVPAAAVARLRRGIERVVEAGYPPFFVAVYDEFFQIFDGLQALLSPLLGDDYLMVPDGLSAFYAESGDRGRYKRSLFGPSPPHRDSLGPDPQVVAGVGPSILNVWIPLTDATLDRSCIYLLPADRDPAYRTDARAVEPSRSALQHVRACPAAAGSVMAWTTHLVHWGSLGGEEGAGPRLSVAMYLQNRDVSPFHESAFEIPSRVRFEDRLRWISLGLRGEVFVYP